MASKCDYLQRIRDSVECPICYLILDKPKSLPCGHTFCHDCIQRASYNRSRSIDYSDYNFDDSDADDDYYYPPTITVSSSVNILLSVFVTNKRTYNCRRRIKE